VSNPSFCCRSRAQAAVGFFHGVCRVREKRSWSNAKETLTFHIRKLRKSTSSRRAADPVDGKNGVCGVREKRSWSNAKAFLTFRFRKPGKKNSFDFSDFQKRKVKNPFAFDQDRFHGPCAPRWIKKQGPRPAAGCPESRRSSFGPLTVLTPCLLLGDRRKEICVFSVGWTEINDLSVY
jgi:hypothetical protein